MRAKLPASWGALWQRFAASSGTSRSCLFMARTFLSSCHFAHFIHHGHRCWRWFKISAWQTDSLLASHSSAWRLQDEHAAHSRSRPILTDKARFLCGMTSGFAVASLADCPHRFSTATIAASIHEQAQPLHREIKLRHSYRAAYGAAAGY